jgi:hypothetical protein
VIAILAQMLLRQLQLMEHQEAERS